MSPASPTLARHLAALGYGTRREVEALCRAGRVTDVHGAPLDAGLPLAAVGHDGVRVDDAPLDPPPGCVVLFHKPLGLTCSTSDRGPLIYDRLPARFRTRRPLLAPVGRLDKETSGLLLLTDDGPLLHRLTSPRSHVPRTYRATLADPLRGDEAAAFATGTLQLAGEDAPLRAAELVPHGPHIAALTIREGRYHQVRRMFAAIGHHVVALHRVAFGPLTLDALPEGAWRVLEPLERRALDDALQALRTGALRES
ncbi:MAG TPA: pseudouridine synthase [Gemmatimonadaceae bacterium]|nr:pseudouridine synthase [Gemmatimonadaceae bacterium]